MINNFAIEIFKKQIKKYIGGIAISIIVCTIFTFDSFHLSEIDKAGIKVECVVTGYRNAMFGLIRKVGFTYSFPGENVKHWSQVNLLFTDISFKKGDIVNMKMQSNGTYFVIEGYLRNQQIADYIIICFSILLFLFFIVKFTLAYRDDIQAISNN